MPTEHSTATRPPSLIALWAAFAAVYVIWGSNFLAIRLAVETIPPFALMGLRSVIAGVILLAWGYWRTDDWPGLREWRSAAVTGALLFLVCHGGLAWAEQYIASGIAALLMSTIPLWVVLLEWQVTGTMRPRLPTWIGLGLGALGVGLLVRPGIGGRETSAPVGPAIALLVSAFAWAAGSVGSRLAKLPRSVPLATGMQLTAGGLLLCALAVISGELRHGLAPSMRSLLAMGYMIVFASIVTLTAYVWLLRVATPARASSYAFVNPLVAVVVGWAFGGEALTLQTALAAAVIVTAVVLIVVPRRR